MEENRAVTAKEKRGEWEAKDPRQRAERRERRRWTSGLLDLVMARETLLSLMYAVRAGGCREAKGSVKARSIPSLAWERIDLF